MTLRRRFLSAPVAALSPLTDEPTETDVLDGEYSLVRVARRAMATTFEVAIPAGSHPDPFAAASAALDLIDDLEDQMTVYRDHSEVSRINASASKSPLVVEEKLFDLFGRCAVWTRETEGAFDIAIGALIKAWGFYHRQGRIPSSRERSDVMTRTGFRHVMLNQEIRSIKFRHNGLELNLGAVGKGYALDRAAAMLYENWGVKSALLHGGGSSIYAVGHPPGETRGWQIRLKNPADAEKSLGTVWLRDSGLGTSAATFQFFEYKGKKFGHLLDPRTGWPADGTASASAISSTAAEADAFSSAAFVLGSSGAEKLVHIRPSLGIVFLKEPKSDSTNESNLTKSTDLSNLFAYNLAPDLYSHPAD
jgi:thiamine biosynthesis lipoprotein